MKLTKEQIEGMRITLVRLWREAGHFHDPMPNALCDMALQSLSQESVRSEARSATLEEAAKIAEQYDPHTGSPGYDKAITSSIAAAIRALQSPARVAEGGLVHTDHPSRHWDRTCPACLAEGQPDMRQHGYAPAEEQPGEQNAKLERMKILLNRWHSSATQNDIPDLTDLIKDTEREIL